MNEFNKWRADELKRNYPKGTSARNYYIKTKVLFGMGLKSSVASLPQWQKYAFSPKSFEKMVEAHKDLQCIAFYALLISRMDFGISECRRTLERQSRLFAEGKSNCNGVDKKSKHQYLPSLAMDLFPVVNGKADWSKEATSYLGGLVVAVADMLYHQGNVKNSVRWGGDWDRDGNLHDNRLPDRPHFELPLIALDDL